MGFSAFYSTKGDDDSAVQVFEHAFNSGVTLFNSATFYGPLNVDGYGANLRLIKKCLKNIDRSKVQLMVKIGMDTRAPVEKTGQQWNMSGEYDHLLQDVDYALSELGTDYIDIIVLCRVPQNVTIEEAVGNMKKIVELGKAKYIGLSEASAPILRRAAAVAPIYCIEQEWSLWSRDAEEEIFPTCRELGIKIVAYSPLGRGFLTGAYENRSAFTDPTDYRLHGQPRLSEENFNKNFELVKGLKAIADRKGVTAGQLALAWVHAQGSDVIPIPGTTSLTHLNENLSAKDITLSDEELSELNTLFAPDASVGGRYAHMALTFHGNK